MHAGISPEALLAESGFAVRTLAPLAGDLSQRRYLRALLESGGTAVLALYPDEPGDDCRRFLVSGDLLATAGVRVPRVLSSDCTAGWCLLEDLGERTLADTPGLTDSELEAYFAHAGTLIARIQSIATERIPDLNPPLDPALLRRELEQTEQALLSPLELLTDPPAVGTALDRLCDAIGHQPFVPCHRDFMVRNLMPCGRPPGLAVIDHQGLRLGPRWYDLASLLNDTLFLAPEAERRLLEELVGDGEDRLDFHRAAAQRTLKAAGTYARFAHAGNRRHVPLIASTFERALSHLALLPETAGIAKMVAERWSDRLSAGL